MKSENFCYMPWHGLAVAANGDIKPCCQWKDNLGKVDNVNIVDTFKNNHKIIKLRQDFLNGERPESCRSCWERENQIGESRRKWFASKFIKTVPIDYEYKDQLDDLVWTQVDINLSNVCNLKCRMCGAWASHSWFEEEIQLAKISKSFQKESNENKLKIRQHELNDLKSLLPYFKNMTRIDFKGGEPMMAKSHIEFLELLIDQKLNDNIILQYTTNGTVINPKILKTLSHFKKVRLMFSIEGTGKLYSYIRGGKYTIQQLEENLAMYNSLSNIDIGFNVTIQAYNLLNLKDLYFLLESWAHKYSNVSNKDAFTTICNSPAYLSPFVLPTNLRELAKENLKNIDDFKVLSKNLESNEMYRSHWNTFKNFTNELDLLRQEKVLDIIPEFKEIW
jgi:radical SAM protein with 4Fe4S-binding SPASM domain